MRISSVDILWSAVFQQTSACKMAASSASAGIAEVLISFYRCGEEDAFERHRSRIPIGIDQRNLTDARKHMINFLGILQMATSLVMGNFELKLYRLARSAHGKTKNLRILTQQQWEMEVPLLVSDETQSELNIHVVQKIINWSDKKMVLVPGVKQTPKEPLGTSTSSSEDKDPEIAIIDNEPGASDSARNRSRKRRQECLEDKELVQNILRDNKVVRNVRQRHELDELQADLGKLAGSSALNEVKFTCGVCKKPYFISTKSSRTTQGKVNYFKITHFNKCRRNYEKAQRLVKNNHTLDSLWKKGNCERLSSASSSNSMSQDEQEDFTGADAIETGSDK